MSLYSRSLIKVLVYSKNVEFFFNVLTVRLQQLCYVKLMAAVFSPAPLSSFFWSKSFFNMLWMGGGPSLKWNSIEPDRFTLMNWEGWESRRKHSKTPTLGSIFIFLHFLHDIWHCCSPTLGNLRGWGWTSRGQIEWAMTHFWLLPPWVFWFCVVKRAQGAYR